MMNPPIMNKSTSQLSWHTCLIGALFILGLPIFSLGAEPSEYILSNGMKVLLVEVPKAPVATVQVWYKVGSRNEVMGRAGLSHMLEHMMFKGTVKYPKGSFSRIIRKNGGVDNAFTGQDFTAYFENVAADRVPLALELEADRMQGLIFDNAEFQTEREVVKEERRLRSEDDPQGALVEALFAQAYMSHPYHWPVIGWFADLDAMTLEDLQRHYDTFYSPIMRRWSSWAISKRTCCFLRSNGCLSRYREDHHPTSLSGLNRNNEASVDFC